MTAGECSVVSLRLLLKFCLEQEARERMEACLSPRELEERYPDMTHLDRRVLPAVERLRGQEKARRRVPLRILKRVLMTAAILISVFSCILVASASVRGELIATIINWNERDVGIRFEVAKPYLDRLPDGYGPHYIPEGLIFDDETSWRNEGDFFYTYLSEDETCALDIRVGVAKNTSGYVLDSEHTRFEKITFQGVEAYLGTFQMNEGYVMLWMKDGIEHYIYTSGGLSLGEVYRIAENIC